MGKWASRILTRISGLKSVWSSRQFAFRTGHQAAEVIAILRWAIDRAVEWAEPIVVIDGDVWKAYDCMVS